MIGESLDGTASVAVAVHDGFGGGKDDVADGSLVPVIFTELLQLLFGVTQFVHHGNIGVFSRLVELGAPVVVGEVEVVLISAPPFQREVLGVAVEDACGGGIVGIGLFACIVKHL